MHGLYRHTNPNLNFNILNIKWDSYNIEYKLIMKKHG